MPLVSAAPTFGDRRALAAAGVAVGVLAAIGVFAGLGGPQGPVAGLSWVLMMLVRAGAAPAAYILAAAGLGRLARPLLRGSRDEWALQLAVGLGLMLSLSHALGVFRLLGGPTGHMVAIGVVGAGVVLLAHQMLAGGGVKNASMVLPLTALPGFAGVALMMVAACNPPGWLWGSEFGGFDALEYHLQLPQEWYARGWLWPVGHNVYSYLPGYVEGAFLHLAAFSGWQATPAPGAPMTGLLAGDGTGVLSCQLLHVGLTVCAGVLIGRATRLAAERCGLSAAGASWGAGMAASLYLLTPWTIVAGSLAYNEGAMVALGAGALVAAMDERLPALRRGLCAGLLVGAACGAKPTALTLLGAPVGIALLGLAPRREWPVLVGAGAAAGAAMLAPWLVRNWYACGNPVFPFASSVFGAEPWTPEQVARYAAGHTFHGSLLDRLGAMFVPQHPDPANPGYVEYRGPLHPQWFLFFPAVLAGALAARALGLTRRLGLWLVCGMAAQVGLWLFTTHIQSRFLIPVAVTGCAAFGLALAGLRERRVAREPGRRGQPALPLVPTLAVLAVAAQGVMAAWTYAGQRGGHPNACLIDGQDGGVGAFTGQSIRAAVAMAPEADRKAAFESRPAAVFVNLVLPPGARVYLLGDSATLYFRFPILHHTTWDTSPLGLTMRAWPDKPDVWLEKLRGEGVDFVLVNFAELDRLAKSGWYDPKVTSEVVGNWIRERGVLVQAWPRTGQFLFSIRADRPPAERRGGSP
jgi:hypothetical protein